MSRATRDGRTRLARDQFLGANVDGEIFIFALQLATSRISILNLTQLINYLLHCVIIYNPGDNKVFHRSVQKC